MHEEPRLTFLRQLSPPQIKKPPGSIIYASVSHDCKTFVHSWLNFLRQRSHPQMHEEPRLNSLRQLRPPQIQNIPGAIIYASVSHDYKTFVHSWLNFLRQRSQPQIKKPPA